MSDSASPNRPASIASRTAAIRPSTLRDVGVINPPRSGGRDDCAAAEPCSIAQTINTPRTRTEQP
jgi:hypothetical protein